MYDSNNVFAKIIRGEIPSKKVYDNEYAFGTEELDYNYSSRMTDVLYAVKQWLGGASFSSIETKEC